MKLQSKIKLSQFNSSGEGTVYYTSNYGSLEFTYSHWGEIICIPTPKEWECKFRTSWAKDKRDIIIEDLASQMVSASLPNIEIEEHAIIFFNSSEREVIKFSAIDAAKAIQSPSIDDFLAAFEKLGEIDKSSLLVCVLDILSASDGNAECTISEILYGSKALTGIRLRLGFDKDVPMFSGRKYITKEFEATLTQYANTNHIWRCRLHVEHTQNEINLARDFLKTQ